MILCISGYGHWQVPQSRFILMGDDAMLPEPCGCKHTKLSRAEWLSILSMAKDPSEFNKAKWTSEQRAELNNVLNKMFNIND